MIVSAVRTPIGRQAGGLSSVPAHVLGATVIKEALNRVDISVDEIEDIILGNVQSGGGNIARLSGLETGLSLEIPGLTVDRQCGSGLNAITLAAQAIRSDAGQTYIAGGVESMSQAPLLLERSSRAYSPVLPKVKPAQLSTKDIGDPPMGITAENLVKKYKISREEQDEFALSSQNKMSRAMSEGRFDEQIISLTIKTKKGDVTFKKDEHPRPETNLQGLSNLKPAFLEGGSVTAGNSSGLNDGASALVLTSRKKAKELNLVPLGVVRETSVSGVDPNIMGIGPVAAVKKVLNKSGLTLADMDLIEINEAFAAQVIACDRELDFDLSKVNVNGGAIAHGHPLGATGAMLVTKAIYELKRTNKRYALITACIGGGQGIATIIENENAKM